MKELVCNNISTKTKTNLNSLHLKQGLIYTKTLIVIISSHYVTTQRHILLKLLNYPFRSNYSEMISFLLTIVFELFKIL